MADHRRHDAALGTAGGTQPPEEAGNPEGAGQAQESVVYVVILDEEQKLHFFERGMISKIAMNE